MEDSLDRIVKQGKEVAIVKLCDRITNLQKPPLKWNKEKIKKIPLAGRYNSPKRLGVKNSYLDNRIRNKIEEHKAYF